MGEINSVATMPARGYLHEVRDASAAGARASRAERRDWLAWFGESGLKLFVFCVLCLLFLVPSQGALATASADMAVRNVRAQARSVVGVVYDDSGSMREDSRWVYANFALSAMVATLPRQDVLYLDWMNAENDFESSSSQINNDWRRSALLRLAKQSDPNNGAPTPYWPVNQAIQKIVAYKESHAGVNAWLVIITDGAFSRAARDGGYAYAKDLESARNNDINVVFVLINQPELKELIDVYGNAAQDMHLREKCTTGLPTDARSDIEYAARAIACYKTVVGAKMVYAHDKVGILDAVAKVANWVNGYEPIDLRNREGVVVDAGNNTITFSPLFPLDSLTLLTYGDIGDIVSVDWAGVTCGGASTPCGDKVRVLEFERRRALKDTDIPDRGRTIHLEGFGDLPAGKPIKIEFENSSDLGQGEGAIWLPKVAASLYTDLLTPEGRRIEPYDKGKYRVCTDTFSLRTRLSGDAGGDNLMIGARIDRSLVETELHGWPTNGGAPLPVSSDDFTQTLKRLPEGNRVSLWTTMAYPGYLYRRSGKVDVVFGGDACHRHIRLALAGVGSDGLWQGRVDGAQAWEPVRVRVSVDGKPASSELLHELELRLANGDVAGALDVRRVDDGWDIMPEGGSSLWWWLHPGPGDYSTRLIVVTAREGDRIAWGHQAFADGGHPSSDAVTFRLLEPIDLWAKIRWYGVPFALLALFLSLAWYVRRLVTKARFGSNSAFVVLEKSADGGQTRRQTIDLRGECNAVARWLWPSRAEKAGVFGMRVIARSKASVLIDGRSLSGEYQIPGWVHNESVDPRRNSPIISHGSVVVRMEPGRRIEMKYEA